MKNKTLEQLENEIWPDLDKNEKSHLISRCHYLRKKPLNKFSVEDLRIMIGQNIGLEFLIPISVEILTSDILAEGDMYKGDLLKSVLSCDQNYWFQHPKNWKLVCNLFQKNSENIQQCKLTPEILDLLLSSYYTFKGIHQVK